MKILHIAPNAPYNDYWGYQENLLPKYHKKMGHDVTILVTNMTHQDGKLIETDTSDYLLNDGIRVIRLAKKNMFHHSLTGLKSYLPVYKYLIKYRPDFVFFHGLLSTSIYDVIKYKKKINASCTIVQDNHLDDYNINIQHQGIKEKLYRMYRRHINRRSINFVDKVYGVTPWRKTFAENYFAIPKNKTDVLIMGADDEKIDFENCKKIRHEIRNNYNISDNEFLIVTGGKIDSPKNIHLLMEACGNFSDVKLLVFGQVTNSFQDTFQKRLDKYNNIINVGWIESDKVYDYFFAADLIFFPGTHSVLWEQACASKVPCVFLRWTGMEHVNNGGNADFIDEGTVEAIQEKIAELKFTEKYEKMKAIAESDATNIYLYSEIAKKSLECAKDIAPQLSEN